MGSRDQKRRKKLLDRDERRSASEARRHRREEEAARLDVLGVPYPISPPTVHQMGWVPSRLGDYRHRGQLSEYLGSVVKLTDALEAELLAKVGYAWVSFDYRDGDAGMTLIVTFEAPPPPVVTARFMLPWRGMKVLIRGVDPDVRDKRKLARTTFDQQIGRTPAPPKTGEA